MPDNSKLELTITALDDIDTGRKSDTIKLALAFNDPDLDDDEREAQALQYRQEWKEMDEIETIERILEADLPQRSKPGEGTFVGLLMTAVNAANAKKVMRFLGERLGSKPIELAVEANGKKLTVKAHGREELEAAIKAAQDFIAA